MITHFRNEWAALSNFYPSVIVTLGRQYQTVEHLFQAFKAQSNSDHEMIRLAQTPGQAKRLGRNVLMKENWNDIRVDVMKVAVHAKFSIPRLRFILDQTGDRELVEGNTWGDTFWGVCNGKGLNMLGKILMEERRCGS